jgi:hypothetical protein
MLLSLKTFFISLFVLSLFGCNGGDNKTPEILKDSDGDVYEFKCDKRPECDNKNCVIQECYLYDVPTHQIDLTKKEEFAFCCDTLHILMDSLKKFSKIMDDFRDKMKGKTYKDMDENFGTDMKPYNHGYYLGKDSIHVHLVSNWTYDSETNGFINGKLVLAIEKAHGAVVLVYFNTKEEVDKYIEQLDGNYKNCCLS